MYRNKEEFIKRLIDGHNLFILFQINKDSKQAISEIVYDSNCDDYGQISYLIQKGRVFLYEKDAIARNNEIINLMLPYNDNRIFDAETGYLLIDVDSKSIRTQYNTKSSQYFDSIELWTINYEYDENYFKLGLGVFCIKYKDGLFFDVHGEEYHPLVLFGTEGEAMDACLEVEKQMKEQPHSMDYWIDGCGDMFFGIDMEDDYSSRWYNYNLPDLLWESYYPNTSSMGEVVYSKMDDIIKSEEGLYRKTDSKYGVELVLRTMDSEWHFRDNMVLIRDEWVSITMLYPLIGIHSVEDIIKTFGIETEQVVLTEKNFSSYIGRKLVYSVIRYWVEDYVDEDTGEVRSGEREDWVVKCNEFLLDSHKDSIIFPMQVTFFKDKNDKMALFLNDLHWRGYTDTLRELNNIIIGYYPNDELDAYTNVHKYLKAHTRISKIGRMRLDKALFNDNSKTSTCVRCEEGIDHEQYSLSNVTQSDFIEIIKLLANKGEGYHPMSDKPLRLSDDELNEIIDQRKNNGQEFSFDLEKKCFEIDYALHCESPLNK